ncbi:hypothetical protein BCV72DRAFT_256168 [Rhizopus microsporus var. microsporus]|uniref:Uncharacterized protein n=1 Tax=Rhizopus microsporus var. microsporus TaxID=86635 RepID=A0A1X0R436_RHIZD|nr:hypothetical protein BCV72DRAFT_256168 [Rhizopus microsporus var. microsporus]
MVFFTSSDPIMVFFCFVGPICRVLLWFFFTLSGPICHVFFFCVVLFSFKMSTCIQCEEVFNDIRKHKYERHCNQCTISYKFEGEEINVLVHESHSQQVCNNDFKHISVVPRKRETDERKKTIELDEATSRLLNTDWSTFPHIKYACSVMLAGMALLINCNEVYGRTRSIDIHRESFTIKMGPNSRYNNVWVTTITDDHGCKLVFGTKSFNSLSTSSLRLDTNLQPEVGPSTTNFTIANSTESSQAKLYIYKKSYEKAKKLSMIFENRKINDYDNLFQLRQLQTKFDHISTYRRCRAASSFTDNHFSQSYSVFTLSECDNGHDISDFKALSEIFREIALKIIHEEDNGIPEKEITGILEKQFVKNQIKKCQSNGEGIKTLQAILNLYGDKESITVIENTKLNKCLEQLAKQLMPTINRVNKHVVSSIKQAFSEHMPQ